jgi:hypothetical protein
MNFLLGEAAQGREGRSAARCEPMDAAARLKSCHSDARRIVSRLA